MKTAIIILLLSVFFCEVSFAQKYSDKIIINPKIKKQFKYRDTCVAVFDTFKDCRCFLDTIKKTIDIEAGRNYDYNLHFQINTDLSAKVEHVSTGDEYDINDKNPFPPFPIKNFLMETNKNPFIKSNQGFLLKYRFGENRPSTHSEYPDKTNEFTGFINCHQITVHKKEYKSLSSKDSLSLAITFLKSKTLNTVLKQLNLKRFKKISGAVQEWKMPIPGFELLSTYQQLIQSEDVVMSIMIIPHNNGILDGSKIILWRYWKSGKPTSFLGSFSYQKFKDKWILMQKSVYNLKTKKSINLQ